MSGCRGGVSLSLTNCFLRIHRFDIGDGTDAATVSNSFALDRMVHACQSAGAADQCMLALKRLGGTTQRPRADLPRALTCVIICTRVPAAAFTASNHLDLSEAQKSAIEDACAGYHGDAQVRVSSAPPLTAVDVC